MEAAYSTARAALMIRRQSILEAHDVVFAEIAARLYLDQLKVDLAGVFEAMPGAA